MAVRDKSVQIIISAEVASALRAFDSAGKAIHKFSVETEKIGRAIDGVFSPLMRGLTTAVTAIGAGMGMLAKSALTVGGDFELTMKRVAGVIGDAEGSFDALTEKAKKMGEELPITATEAADAMLLLAQAGKKTNDILSIVDDTTALAISQNYGLAETTKLVVSTMSMFGLEAKDSERIVDNFTNACNNSALTMEKFSNGMSYVGELAQSFGLSLEETTGMLALLSRSGLEGEKMATSLRAILINLRDPTAQASAAFKELGITLTDASGKMKPPVQLLRELAEAGMTVDQAIQIFDRRAIGAGLNLSKFVSELDGTVKKMWETGTTTQRLNELLDTFKNRTKEIASAWEGTLLVVFDQINVKSKAVVQEITALIRVFNEWAREQKVFEKVFNALMEGFGIAVGNVNRFKESLASINVDDIAEKFRGFAEGVQTAYNAFMNFAEKVPWEFLAEHLDKIALTIVTGWAAGKFLLITAALGKLAAVIVSLSKALYGLAAAQTAASGGFLFSAATGTSLAAFGAGLAGALGLITAFPEALADNADNAKLWQEAIDGNAEALAKLSKEEQAFIQQNYLTKKEISETAEAFNEVGEKVKESLTDMVRRVVDTYSDETVRVNQLVALFSTQITDAMKVSGGVEAFIGQFAKMEPELQKLMSKVVYTVQEGASGIGKAGDATVEMVAQSLKKSATDIQEYFLKTSENVSNLVSAGFLSSKQGVESLKDQMSEKAEDIGKDLAERFDNPALKAAVVNAMREIGKQSGNALFVEVANAMQKVEKTVSDKAKSILEKAFEEFDTMGVGVGNVLKETENFVGMVMEGSGQSLIQIVNKTTGAIVATGHEAAKMMGTSVADILRENQTLARTTGGMVAGEFNTAALKLQEAARKAKAATELAGDAIGKNLAEPLDRFAGKSVKLVDDGMGNLKMTVINAAESGGTAFTGKMIPALEKTGETAKTTGGELTKLSAEAVKVADGFKAAIDGIDAAISTMGERMVSALHTAVEGLKTVFEQIGIDSGNSMMTALNRQVEAAIPSLSATAANAGMSMGQSMGRSLESAMQTSLQNIARAVDAMARRAAAAVPAAAGSGGNVDAAALAAAYAREG